MEAAAAHLRLLEDAAAEVETPSLLRALGMIRKIGILFIEGVNFRESIKTQMEQMNKMESL